MKAVKVSSFYKVSFLHEMMNVLVRYLSAFALDSSVVAAFGHVPHKPSPHGAIKRICLIDSKHVHKAWQLLYNTQICYIYTS